MRDAGAQDPATVEMKDLHPSSPIGCGQYGIPDGVGSLGHHPPLQRPKHAGSLDPGAP